MNDTHHRLALPQGTHIQDFEFHRVLGQGGFGITYLGWNIALDIPVAIKEYFPSDLATREYDLSVVPQSSQAASDFEWGLDRFIDEARILARFHHPNIVRVHHFFEAHSTAYIVMEYAEGETLSAFLERKGTLKEAELKAILYPLLDGLEVVHRADFLHRDIKPGNIIIRDEDNSPVLLDFGSARQAIGTRSRSVTSIITPGYAPIEQYSSRGDQGPWTDIYALGGVCYRALTGEVPNDATDRMRDDPLVPVSERCAGQASAEFLSAIDWALAVDEGDRPQSITEWRTKLKDDSTKHEPVPVSQQGRHQGEKTIDDLPNHPPLEDVQKMLLSVGLADAARQLGVSAGELDFIRKKYSLRLPKHIKSIARKKTNGKLRAVVLCVVALIVVGVKIYVDRTEKKHQEQAALEKQRQEQVAEQAALEKQRQEQVAEQAALEKQRQEQAIEQVRLAAEQAALEKQRQEQAAEQARLAAKQSEKQLQEQAVALEKQHQGQAAEQTRLAAEQAEKQRQAQASERARTEEESIEFFMVEQKPKVIKQVNPVYPEIARKAGLTGKVFLKFLVDKNGQVSNVTVLRGQEIFRQAAIDAILQYRFEPAEKNGKPVSVWMTQPMSFRLN